MIAPPVVRPPICVGCALYDGERCEAFGDVPPEPILWSEADHRQPFQGDGGRQFTPVAPWASRYAASTFEQEAVDTSAGPVQPLTEFAYSPYQKRDQRGRFGSGGSSGTNLGVSRERPELGGGDVHTYGDLEAARKNPVIAKAERETEWILDALGIDVVEKRQVAGVFEGGGEPSLMLTLSKGTSLEDADVGAAYLVRRNEQDSVITNVLGPEMERLGLQPNGKLIRIEGLPTDAGSRERIFKEIQDSTPFASWDEKAGTVEVSYFDADLSTETRRGLDRFATEHGASMTLEPTHTRWTFHDDATRAGAREYLNPGDPSVLRTADDVIAQYPGDRTARIGPVRGSGIREAMGGGGGAGPSASLLGDHVAGARPEGLTWAYSPGQKRDTKGRFGSGGGGASGGGTAATGDDTAPSGHPSQDRLDEVGAGVAVHSVGGGPVINPLEVAVLLDADGKEVRRKTDQAVDYVEFSTAEIKAMKDQALIHNHPSGRGLSDDDINLAGEGILGSIHAYGTQVVLSADRSHREQNHVRFSMYRPDNGIWLRPRMRAALMVADVDTRRKHEERIEMADGDPTRTKAAIEYANQHHSEEVNRLAADLYNGVQRTGQRAPGAPDFGDPLPEIERVRFEAGTW